MEIELESVSKLFIQDKVKKGDYDLVWSFMLDFENSLNPNFDNIVKNSKYKSNI
jgi:hypothetical protein